MRRWLFLIASFALTLSQNVFAEKFGEYLDVGYVNAKDKTITGWQPMYHGEDNNAFGKWLGDELVGKDNIVLKLWSFGSNGINNLKAYYSPDGERWGELTVKDNQTSILVSSTKAVFFSVNNLFGSVDAVTVGPLTAEIDDIVIDNGFDMQTIIGKAGRYGIEAQENGQTQIVEIVISHPKMNQLTQAYARIEYSSGLMRVFNDEEQEHPEPYWSENSVQYTAITPTGEIELTPIHPNSFSGGTTYSYDYVFLPPFTSGIRVRWEFNGIVNEPEIPERLIGVVGNPDFIEGSVFNFCKFIRQDAVNMIEKVNPNYEFIFDKSPASWYDLDGDGVMEWYAHQKRTGSSDRDILSMFSQDRLNQLGLNLNFGHVDYWTNYGNGEIIGGIDGKTVFTTSIGADGKSIERTDLVTAEDCMFTTIDYDNDGRTDFLALPKNSFPSTVYSLGADGTLYGTPISIISPEEYYNKYDVPQQSGGVVSSGGLGSGVSFVEDNVGKTPAGTFSDSQFQIIDLNNDGYPDFVNADGSYFMNMRNGMFIGGSIGGRVIFRDLDGDGLNDKITYDSSEKSITVTLQRPEGEESVRRKLFSGLNCSSYIWCRDFDRDGDVDILVPFDGPDNSGQAYLVMFENKGDGTFKRHEYFIEDNVRFSACADIDADGHYEVVAINAKDGYHTWGSYDAYAVVYNLDGLTIEDAATEIGKVEYFYNQNEMVYVADFDNSGESRIIHTGGYYKLTGSNINERPKAPGKPTVKLDDSTCEVTVNWSEGSDKETSTIDLTYSLRIGTAPGKADILWADASAEGLRRNLSQGNCGYSRVRKFNAESWPEGTIYISVQTVDDSGLGSEFSEYATFEKKTPAAGFAIVSDNFFAVDDEALISLSNVPVAGNTYEWDVDGGIITEQTDATLKVRWSTPGEKTVKLSVTNTAGATSTVSHRIKVMRVRFENGGLPYGRFTIDLDCDGKAETLCHNSNQYSKSAAFYEGDSEGNYSRVKRLFNTALDNYSFTTSAAVDINHDGLPDLVADKDRQMIHLINEDALSMDVTDMGVPYHQLVADFDNDGNWDAANWNDWNVNIYRNNGDYCGFSKIENDGFYIRYAKLYDYDADGLIDIITSQNKSLIVLKNYGDFVFKEIRRYEYTLDYADKYGVGDFDADGLTDIVIIDSGNMIVCWGDGNESKIEPFSGLTFEYIQNIYDLDNNGSADILCYMRGKDTERHYAAIYFNEDHSSEAEIVLKNASFSSYPILTRTDGSLALNDLIIKGSRTNTPPTTPNGLKVTNNGLALIADWESSTDAESVSKGLKYNIAVRRINVKEPYYIISPLNGGKDYVPVPSSAHLLNSTHHTLPLSVLPDGEYEIRVQAVDSRMATSAFSEPVVITVKSASVAYLPAESMVGKATGIRLKAGVETSEINFGENSEIIGREGNMVTVVWWSEGDKKVTASDFEGTIHIHPALDAYVYFPEGIQRHDKVRVACDNVHDSKWEIYTWASSEAMGAPEIWNSLDLDGRNVTLTPIDDYTSEFVFKNNTTGQSRFRLRHTLSTSYGDDVADISIYITESSENAETINIVDIDKDSGCYALKLKAFTRQGATGINIFRETARSDEYEHIATVPDGQMYFVDYQSQPKIKSERYRVSHALPYGESAMSLAHQPMHLNINKGNGNSWNLIWNEYEGCQVTTYRILRGTTENNLDYLDEVSGNITSYTDFSPLDSETYYAVEILVDSPMSAASRTSGITFSSRSNTVCSSEASGIDDIIVEDTANPCLYYNLSGVCLGNTPAGLPKGIYIKRTQSKTEKIIVD